MDIKKHQYFYTMDWNALEQGKLDGPIKIETSGTGFSLRIAPDHSLALSCAEPSDPSPPLIGADDVSNFESYSDDVEGPGDKMGSISPEDQVGAVYQHTTVLVSPDSLQG